MHNRAHVLPPRVEADQRRPGQHRRCPGLTIATEDALYIHGSWNANAARRTGRDWRTERGDVGRRRLGHAAVGQLERHELVHVALHPRPTATGRRTRTIGWRSLPARTRRSRGRRPARRRPTSAPTAVCTTSCACSSRAARVHYRGSIATFFYSRQAIGVYKCCNTVYGAPDPTLLLRYRLPGSGAAAAADADVPRHELARLCAGGQTGQVSARPDRALKICRPRTEKREGGIP